MQHLTGIAHVATCRKRSSRTNRSARPRTPQDRQSGERTCPQNRRAFARITSRGIGCRATDVGAGPLFYGGRGSVPAVAPLWMRPLREKRLL